MPPNAPRPSAWRLPRPIPDSLSQISRRGTRPSCCSNSHIPRSRSAGCRVGIIRVSVNVEFTHVITNPSSSARLQSSTGIFSGANHRSHRAASPGSHINRSAGSTGRCPGRSRRTLSLNQVIDPVHPTHSAITVAGISDVSFNSCRTRGSNGVNLVGTSGLSYFGGRSEATALATVVRPTAK